MYFIGVLAALGRDWLLGSTSCISVPEITDDFLPGVGSTIVCPIRGGFSIGQETLNRAFTAHTLTLPAGPVIVLFLHSLSTGERPFTDILQDRRYWVIHLLTVPSLFAAGCFCVLSGLAQLALPTALDAWTTQDGFVEILSNKFSMLTELTTRSA